MPAMRIVRAMRAILTMPAKRPVGVILVLLGLSLLSSMAFAQGMAGSKVSAASTSPTPNLALGYRIELIESAEVTTETVYLQDVARMEAAGPERDGLEQLAKVEVGRVPLVGQTIRIPAGYIPVKLRQAGVSLDRVSFEFPQSGSIVVTRVGTGTDGTATATAAITAIPSTEASPSRDDEVRAALIAAIRARAEREGRPSGASWQVTIEQMIGLERIPVGAGWTWELGSWVPVPGRFTLFARLRLGADERAYPVTVYGELRANVEVVVARSDLPTGKLLGPEDVELRLVDSSSISAMQGVLTRPEDAIGRQLRRGIAGGEPLRASLLSAPLALRRGDRFTAELRSGWVTVTVLLEAMEDGRIGSLIRSRNVDTGQVVTVRVTPDGPVPAVDVGTN